MWEPPFIEPGIPPHLTMPGVMIPNDLTDPVREAVLTLLGEPEASQRKLLMPDDVTQDERGLRHLIEAGSLRAAINLTGRLLTMYGQGYGRGGQPAKHTPFSLQLWFTRFGLLVKLGLFELCQSEAEAFGVLNRADIFYECYPEMYDGRKGSMACFSFRLLLAELPIYTNSLKIAMDRLTDLAGICTEIKEYFMEDSTKIEEFNFWEKREIRVLHSLVNCALLMKDYSLVDNIMKKLSENQKLAPNIKRGLLSAWGRIYLHCGDVVGAEQKFSESRKSKNSQNFDLRDFVDKGLVAVAQNDFQEAYGNFQKAFALDPANIMLYNNMGVCLLYCGKLKESIAFYEKAILNFPREGLNENLLLNLATLYELESNNAKSKKLNLLKLINKHKADLNLNLDLCLKLQTLN